MINVLPQYTKCGSSMKNNKGNVIYFCTCTNRNEKNGKMLVIVALTQAVLLPAVVSTLISLTPTAHAQTQGGCPSFSNPQNHFCGNPHQFAFDGAPPIPSCTSPNSFENSPNPISGACRG